MIRKALPKTPQKNRSGFQLRGHEVKRIETFSDAVFAFAVTLLIVSLEVPHNFDELMTTMRGFFAFGICFTILVLIWHEQHVFFRRYGMDDAWTIALNCALLFIVLFYVYPLKFLFSLAFSDNIYGSGKSPFSIKSQQLPLLMIVYGVGFILIYSIITLLYIHALGKKTVLDLTATEAFDTRTKIYSQIVMISIGLLSIIVALVLPPKLADLAGFVYFLIGIALTIYYSRRTKIRRRLFHE
jgi:uncharacterized membrane protein